MYSIKANDINEAFPLGMLLLNGANTTTKPSRNGEVVEYNEAVATTYMNPTQRVLFNAARDCNPFFHFMEGLWMLAGRNDVAWIEQFNSKIGTYSDDGIKFHGAYGERLIRMNTTLGGVQSTRVTVDQLMTVAKMLRSDPTDRRAVVNIWECGMDLDTVSKDIPCNDLIFFKVRDDLLHMTVCCRSNDAIWGCYGANAVHFSMIQEWVASMAGYDVGTYTQVSDSLHVYTDNPQWEKLKNIYFNTTTFNPYDLMQIRPYPMFEEGKPVESWDSDLKVFMNLDEVIDPLNIFVHSFFYDVAIPMRKVWKMYKQGLKEEAFQLCSTIKADDWRFACSDWIDRRIK